MNININMNTNININTHFDINIPIGINVNMNTIQTRTLLQKSSHVALWISNVCGWVGRCVEK